MKRYFVFILLPLLYFNSFSQQKNSSNAEQLQLEAFGPGSLFSLNFDIRFAKKENGLGIRAGLGGSPLGKLGASCNSGTLMTLPLGLNYLVGKKNHFIELGVGGVLPFFSATKKLCIGFKGDFFSDDIQVYEYILVGYRYQPYGKKGVTYRAFVSPLFQPGFPVKLWGGFSIGFRF